MGARRSRRLWWLGAGGAGLLLLAGCTHHTPPKPNNSASAPSTSNRVGVQAPIGGVFGAGSVWRVNVAKAPVADDSKALVTNLAKQVTSLYGGVAAFNVHQYNTSFYVVTTTQRPVTVKWDDCQGKGAAPAGLLGAGGQFTNVPIPDHAVPSSGTDASLTIYRPGTDTMWDLWQVRRLSDGWHACWGGRMDRVASSAGYFTNGFGTTATGLASIGGTVLIKEAAARKINHALTLQIPKPAVWSRYSYPAQRSDGSDTSRSAIPEGTRFRLNPKVNVAKLHLHPIAATIARAAQKYGFIVTDKAGAVSVVAESGNATRQATGKDPWAKLLRGTPDYAVMKNFPWKYLQALPQNYGKP